MTIQTRLARITHLIAAALLCAAAPFAAADTATLDAKAPCDRPEYPRASLVNEEQGTVVLALLIAPDGKVVDSKVEKSSGFRNLDKAALKIAGCKFKPLKAEQAWGTMEYVWKLQ